MDPASLEYSTVIPAAVAKANLFAPKDGTIAASIGPYLPEKFLPPQVKFASGTLLAEPAVVAYLTDLLASAVLSTFPNPTSDLVCV